MNTTENQCHVWSFSTCSSFLCKDCIMQGWKAKDSKCYCH